MDAIRKKMQTMKCETDELYAKIAEITDNTKNANAESDKFDMDIRDTGKKVQKFETSLEEILEKMMQSTAKMDEAEKEFKDKDDDVNAQSRRVLLLEEECRIRNVIINFDYHNFLTAGWAVLATLDQLIYV